jgi:putative tricarboxylic transport membrane protein
MPRKETIVTAILLVYSLAYFLGSFRLDLGTLDNPGCGVIPRVVGLLLLILAAVNLQRLFRGRGSGSGALQTPAEDLDYRAVLGMIACVVAYPLLLSRLKFLPATFLIVFVMFQALRYRRAVGSALIAAGVTLATFLIFTKILGVVFPSGTLEHYVYALF